MFSIDEFLNQTDLYITEFPEGWRFTWRLLSLKEYRVFAAWRATGTVHEFIVYRKVFDRCYLGDPNLLNEKMPMFVPISIGRMIMYLSGDCNAETIRDDLVALRAAYPASDVFEIMKRIIVTAFPTVDYFSLEELSRAELLKRFVSAEAMMQFRYGDKYQPLDASQILVGGELDQTPEEEVIKPVDIAAENAALAEHLHPWDFDDMAEQEYAAKKAVRISPEQAKKLDRRRPPQ